MKSAIIPDKYLLYNTVIIINTNKRILFKSEIAWFHTVFNL